MTEEICVFVTPNTYEQGQADKDFEWVERIGELKQQVKNKNIVYIDISECKVSWAVIDREIELLDIVLDSLLKEVEE